MLYVYDFPVALKRGNIALIDNSFRIVIYQESEHSYVVPSGSIVNPIDEKYDSYYPNIFNKQKYVNRKLLCTTESTSFWSLSEAVSFIVGFDTTISMSNDYEYHIEKDFEKYFKTLIWSKGKKCVWRVPDIIPCTDCLGYDEPWNVELFGCEEKNNVTHRFDLQSILMLLAYTHKGDNLKELINNAIVADSFYNPS